MSPTSLSSPCRSHTGESHAASSSLAPSGAAPAPVPTGPRPSLRWPSAAVLLALLALAAALPATADWLVTRDGGRMETKGEWEVKGRLVVFTTADGQLSSLRLDDVDLEASREATEAAANTAREGEDDPPAAQEPPPARRKITDADIPPGRSAPPAPPSAPEGAAGADAAEAGGLPEGPPASNLVVVFSEGESADDGHTRVRGRLANRGAGPAVGVRLTVHLYGFEGETLGSVPAQLESTALQAGQEADFVADFPEVYNYAAMSFEPRGTSLANTPPEAVEEPTEEEEEG